jgi:hypothetical protein
MATEPVYNMSLLDKVTGNITISKIKQATNQIASILTFHQCDIDESQDYGHAWIILENGAWLTKNNVTAAVPIPIKPKPFVGTTSAEKYIYKTALKNYTDYKTHSLGAIKMIRYVFDDTCFFDLEDEQGQMIGYTPHEIITHICDANVTTEDHDAEILDIEDRIREPYDPSEAPQVYFKLLQTCRILLIQLGRDCPEQTLIRQAMKEFNDQSDLHLAIDEWTKKPKTEKSWTNFKIFFGKEIKKNNTRGGTFKKIGLANAVMQQRIDTSYENQQILTANSIEQNNSIEAQNDTIKSLVAEVTALKAVASPAAPSPALANAATTIDADAKLIATITAIMSKMNTGGSGSGSGNGGGSGSGTGRNKRNEKDKDGKRKQRRYDNDNYCWTCGFDINTPHTSTTCRYVTDKANHKKEATASNTMGGSQRNMHLRTGE